MARTTTEFPMKKGVIESINTYLTGQGYMQGEIDGCPAWGKEILPLLTFFMAKNCSHYVQLCDMGDRFVLDEWMDSIYINELPVDRFSVLSFGGVLQQLVCIKKHNDLVNYIKNL